MVKKVSQQKTKELVHAAMTQLILGLRDELKLRIPEGVLRFSIIDDAVFIADMEYPTGIDRVIVWVPAVPGGTAKVVWQNEGDATITIDVSLPDWLSVNDERNVARIAWAFRHMFPNAFDV